MRTESRSESIRDIIEILFIDHLNHHYHRPLDELVLKGGDTKGSLPLAILRDPDPLARGCLIATFLQPPVEIVKIRLQVFPLGRSVLTIHPHRTILASQFVGPAQQVLVDQMGQIREYPVSICRGLRRYLPKLR
jgi:hypothetical protein